MCVDYLAFANQEEGAGKTVVCGRGIDACQHKKWEPTDLTTQKKNESRP